MAIRNIRKPSDTPNINNYDDYRIARFAFGNYNGYLKGYGNELNPEIDGSTFRIKSGFGTYQGVDFEVDSNGIEVTVDNVAQMRYYTLYLEINLALDTIELKSLYSTTGFPSINPGDDLSENPQNGIASFMVYRFQANNGIILNNLKQIDEIPYLTTVKDELDQDIANIKSTINKSILPTISGIQDELADQNNDIQTNTANITTNTNDISKINSIITYEYQTSGSAIPATGQSIIYSRFTKIGGMGIIEIFFDGIKNAPSSGWFNVAFLGNRPNKTQPEYRVFTNTYLGSHPNLGRASILGNSYIQLYGGQYYNENNQLVNIWDPNKTFRLVLYYKLQEV